MDSHQLIDAQFDRAVEIVQSLPKNGPIQTDYEEKLTMYRCVTSARVPCHPLTCRLFALAYTNKVLTRVPPPSAHARLMLVTDFQQLWVMSLPPGPVFGTCLGERNGVCFPPPAFTLATPST
jgi:hypothetical protein